MQDNQAAEIVVEEPQSPEQPNSDENLEQNGIPMMLPNSCITRCIKSKLSGVGITKDAKQEISKALHIFLLYLTSAAQETCVKSKRQTLGASDVNKALQEIDFEAFIPEIDAFIQAQKKKAKTK